MTNQAMQEPTFLILTALAAGAQHGYGIMTDVARISGDRVRLRAGTLYAALDRLRGDGLIDADREEIVDGRLRRYYRLTPSGADALAAETARMRSNAAVATRRLRTLGMSASCTAPLRSNAATAACWSGSRRSTAASTQRR